MHTAHLYNKARKRWLATPDLLAWAMANGIDLDELLARLDADITATPERRELLDLSKAAYGLAVGIEIGKLLCDPATHLEPGDMDPPVQGAPSAWSDTHPG